MSVSQLSQVHLGASAVQWQIIIVEVGTVFHVLCHLTSLSSTL